MARIAEFSILACVLVFACLVKGDDDHFPIVQTIRGPVKGINVPAPQVGVPPGVDRASKVRTFLGIPYAKVTTRFRPAENVSWTNEKFSVSPGPDCHGMFDDKENGLIWNSPVKDVGRIKEDCLNLNVWAPEGASNLPVLVWIFGGGFFSGSPNLQYYDPTALTSIGTNKLVVVNINYRLGPFGFLNLDDQSTNLGLLDQQMALKWIKDNIDRFGGNPNNMILAGESAGAASVTAHMIAPDSKSLFNKAILLSGTITAPWATRSVDSAKEKARELLKSEKIGCPAGDDDALLACGQSSDKSPDDHIQAAINAYQVSTKWMEFAFIPAEFDTVFFKNKQSNVPIRDLVKNANSFNRALKVMIGTVADEGSFWLPYYNDDNGFTVDTDSEIDENQLTAALQKAFSVEKAYYTHDENQLANIRKHYRQDKGLIPRDAMQKATSDFLFACPTMNFADQLVNNGLTVYSYFFNQRTSSNPWPLWMGVMHGYEIEYFFGTPFIHSQLYTNPGSTLQRDRSLSLVTMKMWQTFARDQPPHSTWSTYTKAHGSIMGIGYEKNASPSGGDGHPFTGPEGKAKLMEQMRRNEDDCKEWKDVIKSRWLKI